VVRVTGYRFRGPGFDSRRYQIFWEVVDLERGPLMIVSTIEVLFQRKSSCSGLEIWEYGLRDSSRWPCGTVYPQKLAFTSPTSSIVRSRTTEFSVVLRVTIRDSSVGRDDLHCGGPRNFRQEQQIFSSPHRTERLWRHPDSCPFGTLGTFTRVRAPGAWSWSPSTADVKKVDRISVPHISWWSSDEFIKYKTNFILSRYRRSF
jgi:hypothetical protein